MSHLRALAPKPDWRERKEGFLSHLESAHPDALLVSAADKLHNATTMLEGHRAVGYQLWGSFKAPGSEQLWYLRSLAEVFSRRLEGEALRLADRLSRVVNQLELETETA